MIARWEAWDACRGGCVCDLGEGEECRWAGMEGCIYCQYLQKKACGKKTVKEKAAAAAAAADEA